MGLKHLRSFFDLLRVSKFRALFFPAPVGGWFNLLRFDLAMISLPLLFLKSATLKRRNQSSGRE